MAFVQQKSVASGSSVTFDNPTTAGNSIIVLARAYGATDLGTTDITDSKSNTYTRRVVHNASQGVTTKAAIYDCQAPTMGSSHQVSISAHTDAGITAIEWSNLTGSPAFDKSAGAGPSSTSAPTTGNTATLAQADEAVFATIASDQGNTDTITENAGQAWSLASESERGDIELAYSAVYKTVAATTALAATWAFAASHEQSCVIATYKVTTGPAFIAPLPIVISQAVKTASYW